MVFINSVLVMIENVVDVASACTSKNKVTHLVNEYSNRWRYQLKAKKYAVQGSERVVEKKT